MPRKRLVNLSTCGSLLAQSMLYSWTELIKFLLLFAEICVFALGAALCYNFLKLKWNQSQKPTACYITLKLTPRLSRLDLIYNPSRFRGDISNITRIRSFSVKWRNDVTTSLRHRISKLWLHQKICLGSIYNPCKFGGDISTIERVRGFAPKWRNDITTSLRHRNFKFWPHQKIRLGPIYNPCKFGGDISTIERVRGFAPKWRNDVITSLRHRNSKFRPCYTMRLGPIYNPSKFHDDISRNKKI